jgi:SAM-dependent MidA family methyltransferase
VAVDYAAVSEPDLAGSLTGYREGRQVMPIPDGSTDLTAHVRFDSLREDGDVLLSQHEALKVLGVSARRPAYDGDPATYLAELSAAGEAAALLDPGGLGEFSWLLHANNCRQPLPPAIAAADQWRARVRRSGTGSPAK